MGQKITVASRVLRNPELLATMVGNELVIVNIQMDRCYELDAIGADIWNRLEVPAVVEALIGDLTADFDGDPKQMSDDVLKFLNELACQGLIVSDRAEQSAR